MLNCHETRWGIKPVWFFVLADCGGNNRKVIVFSPKIHENYAYIPVRPSYILQLHRDLLQYAEKSFGGQFKNSQNYISETRADGSQFVRFTPMAPYETPAAVEAICESYQRALDAQVIDPLILMPIFINDFLCIHSFNDGNGRNTFYAKSPNTEKAAPKTE